MKLNAWTICQREYLSFFRSMSAWTLAALFTFFSSFITLTMGNFILTAQDIHLDIYFQTITLLFTFLLPALCMNTWPQEYTQGRLEVLYCLPLSLAELVFCKAVALYLVFLSILSFIVPFLVICLPLANFEIGLVFTQVLGIILLGFSLISFAIFISALWKNPIIAYVVTLLAFLLLQIAQILSLVTSLPPFLRSLFRVLAIEAHYSSFRKGIICSQDLLYFLLISFFFLYLCHGVLQKHKY